MKSKGRKIVTLLITALMLFTSLFAMTGCSDTSKTASLDDSTDISITEKMLDLDNVEIITPNKIQMKQSNKEEKSIPETKEKHEKKPLKKETKDVK